MIIWPQDLRAALEHGDLQIDGRLVDASNATLRCTIADTAYSCVYKPVRGERPLWDFPDGTLSRREIAAYEVARLAGFDCVPLTVWREDGPYGPGMCQVWIDTADDSTVVDIVSHRVALDGWLSVLDGEDSGGRSVRLVHEDSARLREIAALDVVLNNADRKGGHLLLDTDARLWAIDHGVCFSPDPKLRTVLWGFAGETISPDVAARLVALGERLAEPEGQLVLAWLDDEEALALQARITALIEDGHYPLPDGRRHLLHWPVL